jgi:hypothetical protein
LVKPHHDEKILGIKAQGLVLVDDLDVSEPLAVGAHLVLAFYDKDAVGTQYAMCFPSGLEIKVQYCVVPLGTAIGSLAVGIVLPKSAVRSCTGKMVAVFAE